MKNLRLFLLFLLAAGVALCVHVTAAALPDAAQKFDQKFFGEMKWRSIGPFRAGRSLAVTGVRGQPDVYYFGSVDGGVWKTNDAGRTWNPIFDAEPVAFDWGDCGGAFECECDLRGIGRGGHALEHFVWQRNV